MKNNTFYFLIISIFIGGIVSVKAQGLLETIDKEYPNTPQYEIATFKATRISIGQSIENRKKGNLQLMFMNRSWNIPNQQNQTFVVDSQDKQFLVVNEHNKKLTIVDPHNKKSSLCNHITRNPCLRIYTTTILPLWIHTMRILVLSYCGSTHCGSTQQGFSYCGSTQQEFCSTPTLPPCHPVTLSP